MLNRLTRAVTLAATLGALGFAGMSLATLPDDAGAQEPVIDLEKGRCFVGCCVGGPPPCSEIEPTDEPLQ